MISPDRDPIFLIFRADGEVRFFCNHEIHTGVELLLWMTELKPVGRSEPNSCTVIQFRADRRGLALEYPWSGRILGVGWSG